MAGRRKDQPNRPRPLPTSRHGTPRQPKLETERVGFDWERSGQRILGDEVAERTVSTATHATRRHGPPPSTQNGEGGIRSRPPHALALSRRALRAPGGRAESSAAKLPNEARKPVTRVAPGQPASRSARNGEGGIRSRPPHALALSRRALRAPGGPTCCGSAAGVGPPAHPRQRSCRTKRGNL
jgi:hypothetical protein